MARDQLPILGDTAINQLFASLNLPSPANIDKLHATADYHSIYILQFASEDAPELVPGCLHDSDVTFDLILRVSGNHLPGIKTLNEVACMRWVSANTTIPVPKLVRFDASVDNLIGYEYMLLERIPGKSVDKIYDQLDDHAKRYLVSQLTDCLVQLQSHSWAHVGGLSLEDDKIVPGPVLDETFWQTPDLEMYWGPGDTVQTLNIAGPYKSYTDYGIACLQMYSQNIEKHPSLAPYHDLCPRLMALVERLQDDHAPIDGMRYIFAHKDLHFANVMCDPVTATITGILDWEFSGVVPAPSWNPSKAFLWNGQDTAEAKVERDRMFEIFRQTCNEQQVTVILEGVRFNAAQEALDEILRHMRALVQVCPRGQQEGQRAHWRANIEVGLRYFDI
ncbi:hypothetical protein P171DRAFT_452634 [Karstenula rhodostoma CBS 690.94]|uniref:Aminoglycoside phosphotransferase domain-containing protein n=1 Tax=Karstenula rhodostoma CBS 690.94 TaxID=1392251 RepID=A0A9P4UGW9_9PLEO|nr:hypothetical protein P171DRAFT_452634 [Karstenula rhodostoma CBS 690.94]